MPSGSYDESVAYRGFRIHVLSLRYGSEHEAWWTPHADLWWHGTQLEPHYPTAPDELPCHYTCSDDALHAGLAWGREAVDKLIEDTGTGQEDAPRE